MTLTSRGTDLPLAHQVVQLAHAELVDLKPSERGVRVGWPTRCKLTHARSRGSTSMKGWSWPSFRADAATCSPGPRCTPTRACA